ncbi:alkaline phosphatase family protein [Pedobacter sp. B4-66]|uniref:alkaline phosphatase family protein n=1 Tax=Pedobacter sp. B4-66 TaxID=2817280 RepID=UPI001BDA6265|nr:alkaline phosphatase family protein [Pedobacter sp. B4-66]
MMMNYKNKTGIFCSLLAVMLMTVFNACKKYENPAQIYEEYGDDMNGKTARKVLIININGAVGADVKAINPTNMAALIKNGKFSFNELKDAVSSDAGSIASMLTGVSSSKHKIVNNSYIPVNNNDNDDHAPVTNYPSIFSRMLDVKPEFKTVTITPDEALDKYLIHADHSILAQNDALVKDSAVNVLKDNDARVIMVDFRSVKAAGSKDGFSPEVPSYKAAIETVDGYIGEMMTALKSRKNYASEDWLVIVTTNRGGDELNSKQGFIICYNSNLKSQGISKEGFNTMNFKGTAVTAVINGDNNFYNAGTNKDFTVQLQAKFNKNVYWPGFLSKSTDVKGHTTTGWTMIFNGGNWETQIGGKNYNGSTVSLSSGSVNINDQKWHTLTLTVKTVGGVRTAATYTDGNLMVSKDISGVKDLTTTEPFKIGYRNQDNSGTDLDFYAADLQYFNVGLDADVVKANIALKDIAKHPNYANLIGYWPLDEGGGSVINNLAPTGYNFILRGSGVWQGLGNDIPVSRTPQNITDGTLSIVATGPDVTALTFYWLRVPVKSTWSLDGVPWISNFEIEYIK